MSVLHRCCVNLLRPALIWGRFAAFCTFRHLLAGWRRLRCDMAGSRSGSGARSGAAPGAAPRGARSVTVDGAALRRKAASAVMEERGPKPTPAMSHLSLRQQASKWQRVAKSLPGTPNRCRTQQNDPQLMQNGAKRPQINAESSKTAPN